MKFIIEITEAMRNSVITPFGVVGKKCDKFDYQQIAEKILKLFNEIGIVANIEVKNDLRS